MHRAVREPAPRVSVLLPVHNGAEFVESALRSVMAQTLREIEILVVDDASTDATPEILARLAAEDPRLRILRPERNLRLPGALNFGLAQVRGAYVARMDADDLCAPTRLARQAAFLDANPEIVLVGCSARHIDRAGRVLKTSVRAQTPFHARWILRSAMAFRHPTFLFRADGWSWRYDPAFTVSEDYDLLARLTETERVACLPEALFDYREHGGSITAQKWAAMQGEARRIAERVQARDLPAAVFDALAPFRDAYFGQARLDPQGERALFEGLRAMLAHDLARTPEHGPWLRRQTAQLAARALSLSGRGPRAALAAFLRHGRGLLPALGARALEAKGLLPRALRSDPARVGAGEG